MASQSPRKPITPSTSINKAEILPSSSLSIRIKDKEDIYDEDMEGNGVDDGSRKKLLPKPPSPSKKTSSSLKSQSEEQGQSPSSRGIKTKNESSKSIVVEEGMIDPQSPSGLLTLDELDEHEGISTNTWAILFLIAYIILGLVYYCFIRTPPLTALDSIYLSVITFTTVGYGDIPIYSRYFQCFYVLLGVGVVGVLLGMLSGDMIEAQEAALEKRLTNVARSMDQLIQEATSKFQSLRQSTMKDLFQRGRGGSGGAGSGKEKPVPPGSTAGGDVEEGGGKGGELTGLSKFTKQMSNLFLENTTSIDTEAQRRQQQKEIMNKLMTVNLQGYDEELNAIKYRGIVDLFFVFVAVFSGGFCMMWIEDWSWEQSIYWACVTVTTVGYGDVVPDTAAGKIFTIGYAIFACALAAKGLHDIVVYPIVLRAKKNEAKIISQFGGDGISETNLNHLLNADLLKRIPRLQSDSDSIRKSEFMLLLLKMMNKIQEKDLFFASHVFDSMDKELEGVLSKKKQQEMIEEAHRRE